MLVKCKKKVKCTLVQALRLCTGRTALRVSRGIAVLFLDHGTRSDEVSASRPGRSLPPWKTRYPLYRKLGGPEDRSGQVRKISPPPGFDPRVVQPVTSRYTDWATRPTSRPQVRLKCWNGATLFLYGTVQEPSVGRGSLYCRYFKITPRQYSR